MWRRVGVAIVVAVLIANVWTNIALTVEIRRHNEQTLVIQR